MSVSGARARVFLALALVAAFASGLMLSALLFLLRPGPPFKIVSARTLHETVQAGEVARIEFTVDVDRVCPALIYGWLVAQDDNRALVRYAVESGGYGTPGRRTVIVERYVPDNAPAGRYCYRHVRTDICATDTYTTPGVDACFAVSAMAGE